MTAHQGFLRRYSRSRVTVEAAVADNCRFDERAGPDRWRRFDSVLSDLVADPAEIDWEDWTEANRLHLDGYCNVPSVSVPDTFLQINQSAWLDSLSDNQSLVRIEVPRPTIANSNLDIDNLKELLHQADNGDGDADRAVRSFFDDWNWRRDARPAFAAFYDEVQQEADDDDWPHALRDRLGLGHYGYVVGAELPVALMRYSLEDVFSARVNQGTLCGLRPALGSRRRHARVLLSGPEGAPYGATVHLLPGRADTVDCRDSALPDRLPAQASVPAGDDHAPASN